MFSCLNTYQVRSESIRMNKLSEIIEYRQILDMICHVQKHLKTLNSMVLSSSDPPWTGHQSSQTAYMYGLF